MDKKEALAKYAYLKRDLLSDGAKESKLEALNKLYYTIKYTSLVINPAGTGGNEGSITPAPGGGLPIP